MKQFCHLILLLGLLGPVAFPKNQAFASELEKIEVVCPTESRSGCQNNQKPALDQAIQIKVDGKILDVNGKAAPEGVLINLQWGVSTKIEKNSNQNLKINKKPTDKNGLITIERKNVSSNMLHDWWLVHKSPGKTGVSECEPVGRIDNKKSSYVTYEYSSKMTLIDAKAKNPTRTGSAKLIDAEAKIYLLKVASGEVKPTDVNAAVNKMAQEIVDRTIPAGATPEERKATIVEISGIVKNLKNDKLSKIASLGVYDPDQFLKNLGVDIPPPGDDWPIKQVSLSSEEAAAVEKHLTTIRRTQLGDGAIIQLSTDRTTGPVWIAPYYSQYAALALLAGYEHKNNPGDLARVGRWLQWCATHQTKDGYWNDWRGDKEDSYTDTGENDGWDRSAAAFLVVAWRFQKAGGAVTPQVITAAKKALGCIEKARDKQDKDGLTWATPQTREIKILMNNTEVYAGLRAGAIFFKAAGESAEAETARKHADLLEKGLPRYWRADKGLYAVDVAAREAEAKSDNDTAAQLFGIAFIASKSESWDAVKKSKPIPPTGEATVIGTEQWLVAASRRGGADASEWRGKVLSTDYNGKYIYRPAIAVLGLLEGADWMPNTARGVTTVAEAAEMARKKGAQMLAAYLDNFASIPSGSFVMGNTVHKDKGFKEMPTFQMNLPGFSIGRTEVTVAMWREYIEAKKAEKIEMPPAPWFNKDWQHSNHPIVNVSWKDIMGGNEKGFGYCQWASEVCGVELRLPTSAQWEYVARGRQGREYPWEDATATPAMMTRSSTSVEKDAGGTASVYRTDHVSATPEGVRDMAGNVWEWCSDWHSDSFDPSPFGPSKPMSGEPERVTRGGSWDYLSTSDYLRGWARWRNVPGYKQGDNLGFRLSSPRQ